jgi:glycosyltransferase involved in cell wall biosynthesis
MQLYLADPGYWTGPIPETPPGVVSLGSLPTAEIHRHVASALCVFYPQRTFAETFGLVFAEANALGTPVLAHPLGAASEILDAGGEGQVSDCTSANVLKTMQAWRGGARPHVESHPDFAMPNVLAEWKKHLDCGE